MLTATAFATIQSQPNAGRRHEYQKKPVLRSANFEAGVSGWELWKDGSIKFHGNQYFFGRVAELKGRIAHLEAALSDESAARMTSDASASVRITALEMR